LGGIFTIVITPNGQRRSHWLHPVQPFSSCSTERLRQATTSKLSTPGGQAATHQPQPVQRGVWMWGSFRGMDWGVGKDLIVHPNPS
jgi:hypothetical protein